jgi:hypothetical protein
MSFSDQPSGFGARTTSSGKGASSARSTAGVERINAKAV